MPIKKSLKKKIEKKLEENTNTALRKQGDKLYTPIKEGIALENPEKLKEIRSSGKVVGLSKGATINVGNFQSFRVEVWMTQEVEEGQTHEEVLETLTEMIDKKIEQEVADATAD